MSVPRVILQTEAAECGLACLAMISERHGQCWSLRDLRQRFPISLKGATLAHLMDVGKELGLQGRPVRLELSQLRQLQTPCILHWNLSHFVVLWRAGRSRITLLDPAYGRRNLTYGELSERFTGVALELTPLSDLESRPRPPQVSIRQLCGPIEGLWSSLSLLLILSLSLQLFVVLMPFFMQWAIDQVLVAADRELLLVLGSGFCVVLALQVGVGWLRGWVVIYLSLRLGSQWTANVFAHLLRLPLGYFEKRHVGDIVSRMGSVQAIQRTLTTSFVEAVIDGLMAAVTVVTMLAYSAKLTLITLAAAALYLMVRMTTYGALRDSTEKELVASARQDSHLLETIRGVQCIKILGRESVRTGSYLNLLNETLGRRAQLARLNLGFSIGNQLIFGVERIAVIWLGVLLAIDNVFSVGMLVAYLAYKEQFAQRSAALIDKYLEFRMLRLHGERLADVVLTPPEHRASTGFAVPWSDGNRLEVNGIGFRYGGGDSWVLRDCSFVVEDGESVAIVGASGCGKTTLVKIMLGLIKPEQGTVRLGDQDIFASGPDRYRSAIAAVMQDDVLFDGTIADNIAFGDDHFDPPRIERAARQASIHEEIVAMPMAYNTLIGDMGSALSGGQKQRVILARALYRQPRILFLDEATSHLDVENERLIDHALSKIRISKIIIAHRRETVASADRVIELRQGRVVREFRPSDHHWPQLQDRQLVPASVTSGAR